MKFVLFVTLIWSILDSGWSITDEEYIQFKAGLAQIQTLTREMQDLKNENQAGRTQIQALTTEVKALRQFKTEQQTVNKRLLSHLEAKCGCDNQPVQDHDLVQNTTIEERVTFLEVQMAEVQEEVAALEDEFVILFDQQVTQDERLFSLEERTLILEQNTDDLDERVEVLEADGGSGGNVTALEERVETLEGTAAEHEADIEDLDERVEALEANGGGGGNVTALEVRVETLEGTAAEHEADIEDLDSATSNLDGRVETLEGETSQLETRLTAAEALIEDLQATDIELDSRISDLEEGGGGATNETIIVFRAVMDETDNDNIPVGSTMIFSDVQLNEGNGYYPAAGVFTVPRGGEGYYYFATHFRVYWGKFVYIDLKVNDVMVCTMLDDNEQTTSDHSNGGCNAVVFLDEGDEVKNVYWSGTDSTPVYEFTDGVFNGFTGFRI